MGLKDEHCTEIAKGTPALDEGRIAALLPQLTGWQVAPAGAGQHRTLSKRFSFTDFLGAMAFVDRLAALAEEEQHHPDFSVHYSEVDVSLWTHTVGGLSENDFILAAKLDSLF